MRSLRAVSAVLALAATGAAQAASNFDEHGPVGQSADVLLIGIPAVALGLTWLLDAKHDEPAPSGAGGSSFDGFNLSFNHMNGSPRHDLGLALARTVSLTYGLKYAVQEERPNGEDTHSFPSGHSSVTFTAAEFIRKEYGWGWGAPAYAAASYVGWSRVHTGEHWTHDVLAGAALGILSNHDFSLGVLKIKPIFMPGSGSESPYKDNLVSAPSLTSAPVRPGVGVHFDF